MNEPSLVFEVVYFQLCQSDEPSPWYETGVLDVFLESVGGVVAVRALFVGGAYLMPYLIMFGLPLLGLVALLRRRR